MKEDLIQLKPIQNIYLQESSMTADVEKSPSTSNGTIPKKKKWDFLDLVGGDGPWQRRIFLVMLFVAIPSATHNLAMSFLAPNLDHWCARPPGAMNLSIKQWRRVGLPADDPRCSRFDGFNFSLSIEENINASYKVVPCDSWEYDNTFYTSTVLSQWDLVCQREWLVSLSKSVFMAGILFSVTVFGHLADRLGRRPMMATSAFIAVSSAIICAFSTSFIMFIVTRFFVAVGISGCVNTGFVLLMEAIGPEFRSIYGLAIQFGWCLGFVSLPAIAWVLRDWFWIQVTLTAPCLILLAIWWMIPESPRWLLAQGRVDEAYKVLSRAASVNGVKISDMDTTLKKVMTRATEVHESGETKSNVFDLLRTPGLWQITLNIYFVWFVCAFVYYGLTYNTNELAGDPFINFALSGAVEFPAYFISIFAIRSLGRRNPLALSMVIGGLACLLSYPLPQNPWWLTVTVSMVGKFCITSSFGIIYVYTAELFPTVLRNVGVGSASFCARFGSILAPFVRELGNATHPVVPQIIFGVLAVVSGALVMFLPETNNCTVPDTVKEAAEASRRNLSKPKLANGNHHVIVTLSNSDSDNQQDKISSHTVFAPSPKPSKPEKNSKKLDDVPEEDSHCEELQESDTERPSRGEAELNNEASEPQKEISIDLKEDCHPIEVNTQSASSETQKQPITEGIDVTAEINCQLTETAEETEVEQKSEL